jgi:hypothetical protein
MNATWASVKLDFFLLIFRSRPNHKLEFSRFDRSKKRDAGHGRQDPVARDNERYRILSRGLPPVSHKVPGPFGPNEQPQILLMKIVSLTNIPSQN